MLSWEYPFAAATQRPAKSSVTALRRQAEELDDEAEQVFMPQFSAKRFSPPAQNPKLSAADTGTAHHKFLQHVALENAADVAALEAEAGRLEREKVLSADERAALNLEDIAAFWRSEPGQKIRAQAANVRRELAFTARFSPAELAAITGAKSEPGLEAEFVVVQGVADLVVLLPKEIWLVDFKTDEVHSERVAGEGAALRAATETLRAGAGEDLFAAGHRALVAFSFGPENDLKRKLISGIVLPGWFRRNRGFGGGCGRFG